MVKDLVWAGRFCLLDPVLCEAFICFDVSILQDDSVYTLSRKCTALSCLICLTTNRIDPLQPSKQLDPSLDRVQQVLPVARSQSLSDSFAHSV